MGEARRRKSHGLGPVEPPSIDAMLNTGKAAHQRRDLPNALKAYSHVLTLAPGHPEAMHLSGLAFVELGELALGLAQLQRAVTLLPDDAVVHFNLGRAHLLAGQPAQGIDCFERALQLQPGYGRAQFQRACAYEALQHTELAADAFLDAARLEPDRLLAHVGASRQLYKLDRLPEAIACQARAAALDASVLNDGRIGFAHANTAAIDRDTQCSRSIGACQHGSPSQAEADLQAAARAMELVVIDDVLPDPLAYRDWALRLPYRDSRDAKVNFPGRQTSGGHASQALCQQMADALGRDLKWGWPDHGAFRLSAASSTARSDVHADHDDDRPAYAGVLYLSLPQHCAGGTSFWRHRETGWTSVPDAVSGRASRWGSVTGFMRSLRDDSDRPFESLLAGRSAWEPLLHVPMRFNRLIIYRSDYFHSISALFGATPHDSRLVQLFFFERLSRRP